MNTNTYRSIAELFGDDERTWRMIAKCNEVAYSILRARQIRSLSARTEIERDSESVGVMSYIAIRKDLDEVIELDAELTQRLFDEVPDLDFNRYWVGYESASA